MIAVPSAVAYVGYKTDVSAIPAFNEENEKGDKEGECMRGEIRRKETDRERGDELERSVSAEENTTWLLLGFEEDRGSWSLLTRANPTFLNRVNIICAANEEATR